MRSAAPALHDRSEFSLQSHELRLCDSRTAHHFAGFRCKKLTCSLQACIAIISCLTHATFSFLAHEGNAALTSFTSRGLRLVLSGTHLLNANAADTRAQPAPRTHRATNAAPSPLEKMPVFFSSWKNSFVPIARLSSLLSPEANHDHGHSDGLDWMNLSSSSSSSIGNGNPSPNWQVRKMNCKEAFQMLPHTMACAACALHDWSTQIASQWLKRHCQDMAPPGTAW